MRPLVSIYEIKKVCPRRSNAYWFPLQLVNNNTDTLYSPAERTMIEFSQCDEFNKELKRLTKKRKSLTVDFKAFCETLKSNPRQNIPIEGLGDSIAGEVYKVKKFVCRSISRNSKNSGIRIIYRYIEATQTVEFSEITFIEMYHKSDKANHDNERIKENFGK